MNSTNILIVIAAGAALAAHYFYTKSKAQTITAKADATDAALQAQEKPVPPVVAGPVPMVLPPAPPAAEAAAWNKELDTKEEG